MPYIEHKKPTFFAVKKRTIQHDFIMYGNTKPLPVNAMLPFNVNKHITAIIIDICCETRNETKKSQRDFKTHYSLFRQHETGGGLLLEIYCIFS